MLARFRIIDYLPSLLSAHHSFEILWGEDADCVFQRTGPDLSGYSAVPDKASNIKGTHQIWCSEKRWVNINQGKTWTKSRDFFQRRVFQLLQPYVQLSLTATFQNSPHLKGAVYGRTDEGGHDRCILKIQWILNVFSFHRSYLKSGFRYLLIWRDKSCLNSVNHSKIDHSILFMVPWRDGPWSLVFWGYRFSSFLCLPTRSKEMFWKVWGEGRWVDRFFRVLSKCIFVCDVCRFFFVGRQVVLQFFSTVPSSFWRKTSFLQKIKFDGQSCRCCPLFWSP